LFAIYAKIFKSIANSLIEKRSFLSTDGVADRVKAYFALTTNQLQVEHLQYRLDK
jgi:hypothetical protein